MQHVDEQQRANQPILFANVSHLPSPQPINNEIATRNYNRSINWNDLRCKIATKLSEPGPFGLRSFIHQQQSHGLFTNKYKRIEAKQHFEQDLPSNVYERSHLQGPSTRDRDWTRNSMEKCHGKREFLREFNGECPWQSMQLTNEQKRALTALLLTP